MKAERLIVWSRETYDCLANKIIPVKSYSELVDQNSDQPHDERHARWYAYTKIGSTLEDNVTDINADLHFSLMLAIDDEARPDMISPTVVNQKALSTIFSRVVPEMNLTLRKEGSAMISYWLPKEQERYDNYYMRRHRSYFPMGEKEMYLPFLPGGSLLLPNPPNDVRQSPKETFKVLVTMMNTLRIQKMLEIRRAIMALGGPNND